MNKENIIRKLTSRKLWLALAAFVSGILTALGHKDTAVTVTGLIMQGAAVISYIIAEGLIDAANKPSDSEEPTIEYRYLDENGVPVDGHYTLIHNVEEGEPVKAESDEEAECPVTVLAYDDYDENGSPVVGNDFPEEGDEDGGNA